MMDKRILVLLLTLIGFGANAQYDHQGADEISRFRPGVMWFYSGVRPPSEEKIYKYDRLIFDLTYNDWIGDNGPFENHWASIGLNTNLMFDIPMTKMNVASFAIGVSHQYTNIRHNNRLVIDEMEKTTTFLPKDTADLFYKNTLSGNSFSIPIEFRFRSKGWKHFKFHIGGKIGYQANLFSKAVAKVDGHRVVNKSYGFPDENKLIYSAHIRFGLRNWALYASYNFNTLFSDSKSTQLNMVQMGLSVSLF